MALVGAVREVQAEDIHTRSDQLTDDGVAGRCRPKRRDDLCPAHRPKDAITTVRGVQMVNPSCGSLIHGPLNAWLEGTLQDADRRQLPALRPLLEGLSRSTSLLREADWNLEATDRSEPVSEMPAEPRTLADLGRLLKSRRSRPKRPSKDAWPHHRDGIGRSTPTSPCSWTKRWPRPRRPTGRLHRALPRAAPWRPVSLKDIIDLRDTPTTAASRVREGDIARRDATVVGRLREAGAIFMGKTNFTSSPWVRPMKTPPTVRSCIRSTGLALLAVPPADRRRPCWMASPRSARTPAGRDRIPSAACGLVGLKPTIGEIPSEGVVPLARRGHV